MSAPATVDRDLAAALADCAVGEESGVATCVRRKLKRLFCIEKGRLTYAVSNVIEEQFHEVLVRSEVLAAADLVAAQARSETAGVKPLRLLVDEQVLDPQATRAQLDAHLRDLLHSTLDWVEGSCTFQRGMPDLDGELTTGLACVPLLLEYTARHPASLEDVKTRVRHAGARPAIETERLKLLDDVQPGPALVHLIEHCDGSTDLERLLVQSPESEEATWRALYGLVLLGIARPETGSEQAADADAVTRAELEARLQSAQGADHYAILELNASCSKEQIRNAYYYLARRYHPDRFRAGPLADLRPDTEVYFSRVTEAYNTLFDPAQRAAYDEQRSSRTAPDRQPQQDAAALARQNFARAKSLIAKGRYPDAVTWLENAIKLDGQQAVYHLELGRVLTRNPRFRDEAEKRLIEANQLDPTLADGYLALGELYLKSRRTDDAVRQFRETLRWEPGHLRATAHLKDLGQRVEA